MTPCYRLKFKKKDTTLEDILWGSVLQIHLWVTLSFKYPAPQEILAIISIPHFCTLCNRCTQMDFLLCPSAILQFGVSAPKLLGII